MARQIIGLKKFVFLLFAKADFFQSISHMLSFHSFFPTKTNFGKPLFYNCKKIRIFANIQKRQCQVQYIDF